MKRGRVTRKRIEEPLNELSEALRAWLKGAKKVAILGIGSGLRGDDALGPVFIRMMKRRVGKKVRLFDCGTVPESFAGPIKRFRPTHILMIDAAQMDLSPGQARLITPDKIGGITISTHAIPLNVLSEYFASTIGCKVALLGVQPKTVGFDEMLSKDVEAALKRLADVVEHELSEL
jgi:hydrogenase 3 maturation protease